MLILRNILAQSTCNCASEEMKRDFEGSPAEQRVQRAPQSLYATSSSCSDAQLASSSSAAQPASSSSAAQRARTSPPDGVLLEQIYKQALWQKEQEDEATLRAAKRVGSAVIASDDNAFRDVHIPLGARGADPRQKNSGVSQTSQRAAPKNHRNV